MVFPIPRKPQWTTKMTKEELHENEKKSFLEWRKKLVEIEESDKFHITPFEKNLNVWRQLWRVIERSDILIQIVDSRNPLLFRSKDLELYIKETGTNKLNLLIINKSDLLTKLQR
jgi:large subunit GTPase 1